MLCKLKEIPQSTGYRYKDACPAEPCTLWHAHRHTCAHTSTHLISRLTHDLLFLTLLCFLATTCKLQVRRNTTELKLNTVRFRSLSGCSVHVEPFMQNLRFHWVKSRSDFVKFTSFPCAIEEYFHITLDQICAINQTADMNSLGQRGGDLCNFLAQTVWALEEIEELITDQY